MMNPAFILILGALPIPFLGRPIRQAWLLALPVVAFWMAFGIDDGTYGQVAVFDYTLVTLRMDGLARVFCFIFLIAAFLGNLYCLNDDDPVQQVAANIYAGSAVGAVLAGDLITLFVYWELTAISSVFLILASGTEQARRAAMRYLIIQVGSGVLLLAGALIHVAATGEIGFNHFGLETTAGKVIFLAFGIKCAFPLLHNWLQDAYPEATVGGTVMLSAFTTKLAVYSLARGYAGTEIEELLPLSSEIRQKRVLPSGALVIVLHTCEFPGGNEAGRRITKAALDALSAQDEFGVIQWGMRGDEWLLPLEMIGHVALQDSTWQAP